MNLKGRSFLTLKDFTPDEIEYFIDLAAELKAKKKRGITGNSLKEKILPLFLKSRQPGPAVHFLWPAMMRGHSMSI